MQRILNQQDEKNFLIESQIFLSASMAAKYEQPKGLISTTSKGPNQESKYLVHTGTWCRRKIPQTTSHQDFILCSKAVIVSGLLLM